MVLAVLLSLTLPLVPRAESDTEGFILKLRDVKAAARPAEFVNHYAVKQLLLHALADPQFAAKASKVISEGHLSPQAKLGLIYVLAVSRPPGSKELLAAMLASSDRDVAVFSAMAYDEAGIPHRDRPRQVTETILAFGMSTPQKSQDMKTLLRAFPRFTPHEIQSIASHLVAKKSLEGLDDFEAAMVQKEAGRQSDLASRYLTRIGEPAESVLLELLDVTESADQASQILSVLSDVGGPRTVKMARRILLDYSSRLQRYAIDILEKHGDKSDIPRLLEYARLATSRPAIEEARAAAKAIEARVSERGTGRSLGATERNSESPSPSRSAPERAPRHSVNGRQTAQEVGSRNSTPGRQQSRRNQENEPPPVEAAEADNHWGIIVLGLAGVATLVAWWWVSRNQ